MFGHIIDAFRLNQCDDLLSDIGTMTLGGLSCSQLETGNALFDALRSTIATAAGTTLSAVSLETDCGSRRSRRAMSLVVTFTLSVSNEDVGTAAVNSLAVSVNTGGFTESFEGEAYARGETASVEPSGLNTQTVQEAVEGADAVVLSLMRRIYGFMVN